MSERIVAVSGLTRLVEKAGITPAGQDVPGATALDRRTLQIRGAADVTKSPNLSSRFPTQVQPSG
jgi:hypothetical protein